ncbi:MAG: hypothetical protein AAF773_10780 [Cyanobacteria bacterium P01_D01_bin.115]
MGRLDASDGTCSRIVSLIAGRAIPTRLSWKYSKPQFDQVIPNGCKHYVADFLTPNSELYILNFAILDLIGNKLLDIRIDLERIGLFDFGPRID